MTIHNKKSLSVGIDEKAMNLSVVGAGYIGLITGIELAMNGHRVTCIDCDSSIVAKVNNAVYPFYEPSLDGLLENCVNKNHTLKATEEYSDLKDCNASFICVGTYSSAENSTNFKNITDAVKHIGRALRAATEYHLVVVKSTVPPGTTENVLLPILDTHGQSPWHFTGQASLDLNLDVLAIVAPEYIISIFSNFA